MIKSHFAFVFLIFFTGVSFSQPGWIEYPTGTTKTIGGIYFLNENTGFFVADTAAVFKSTNGGLTWSRKIITYVEPNGLAVIKFINNLTGFAAGGYEASGPYGGFYFQYIYKSTNGGDNWFLHYNVQGGGNCQFNDMYCSTENIFVTGDGISGGIGWASTGGIFKSTNGGTNFILSFTKGASTSLSFINPYTGWVNSYWIVDYGMTKGFLMKTTNGGVNWIEQIRDSVPNLTAIKINQLQFVNENTGYAIAIKSETKFLKSTNGGTNWVYNTFPNGENALLFFTDANTGWIAGVSSPDTSGISRTTDGGNTWTKQNRGNSGTIFSLYFINGMTGWAGKANGRILKTVNGGVTNAQNISHEVPASFSLSQNYPNPFNPATKIKFDVSFGFPTGTFGNDKIVLKVYEITGREVQTLVNEALQPGSYEVTFDGTGMNSGVYFYQLTAGNFKETRRMILTK